MELVTRFLKLTSQSFFLFGPRGTGKSLWVKHLVKDAHYIDFLNPETYRTYLARPEKIIELLEGSFKIHKVVIDEIQKVPEVLDAVQLVIEKNKNMQFVLTGSSARKLKQKGVNLLGGRAVLKFMHPFMATELGKRFSLREALQFGMLPLIWFSSNKNMSLKAYHALYLREEIQQEALVRNLGNFTRFLEALSFSHAAILNISNVARECQVERKTVEGYLTVLEDLMLSFYVPVFTKKMKRKIVNHPKFYFFDCGVYRSLRPSGILDKPEEINGPALEGLVVQHLRAWIHYREKRNELFYWRTTSGVEVDCILYGDDGLWAIEIKHSARVRPEYLKGLESFKEDYPQSKLVLIYMGKEKLKIKNVICLPCEEFLLNLSPEREISVL